MTEMTKIPQPEIEAYHAGYQAGYENGKRDAVKHGEWVEDSMIGEGVYRCTNCDDKFVTLEGTPYDNRLFYCPFCGAKMDGGVGA